MTDNTIYELLTNAETGGKIIDSIKVDNFWIKEFLTDNVVIDGDSSIYYSSNPADGVNHTKTDMTWDEDTVFKCSVPTLIDKVYQCRISKDMLRIATGSAEKGEMIAALQANNLKKKLDLDIMDKCLEATCKKTNFVTDAYLEMNKVDFDDPEKFLGAIFTLTEKMKHPTNKYNKGYKEKVGTNFIPVLASSGSLKNMIIILDTDKKTNLRLSGSKTTNYSLVNLESEFKSVYDAVLPNNLGALILSEDSFALNWSIDPQLIVQDHNNDPRSKKVSLSGFVVGGPISFVNQAAIAYVAPTPTP